MGSDHDICELQDRGIVTLEGGDTLNFLQDLVTADVTRATRSEATYGLLLTPQGKFLFDFFILRDGERWILECERDRADVLVKRLTLYRLRKKIDIANESDRYTVVAMPTGEAPASAKYAYQDPRLSALGIRAILAGDDAQALASDEKYERLRLELGVPSSGRDLVPEASFPLEGNLDELMAIDFDKGCYVGQEVTTRSKRRGNRRKRILPVTFSKEGVLPGSEIRAGEKNGGQVLSVHGDLGLAMIRLERWNNATGLMIGDIEVTPTIPEWLELEAS